MPKIKIDYVVSFSSEDLVHVANNILLDDPAKKWKCKSKGEISATLILQLEKACVISGIDIGNEHSAYVEVLVSRSGSTDDYKVLLLMSPFMNSSDAKNSKNVNEVKMFTKDQLQKPTCDEKWDRVKIICTQPFNRHVQYGLSFIRLQTSGERPSTPIHDKPKDQTLDILKPGSLFKKWKEQKNEPVSIATAIREAAASPNFNRKKIVINAPTTINDSESCEPKERNRKELLYSRDEEEPHEKIDKLMDQHKKELKEKQEKEKEKVDNEKQKKKELQKTKKEEKTELVSDKEKKRESLKRKQEAAGPSQDTPKKPKVVVKKQQKPFSQLLSGVVLVISGIQNPDRGNLRGMALKMGAKYKPDWDNTCTHLICAFMNTPKFKQVQGKGKIVTKQWIEECHSLRKRLPWRRFALDKSEKNKPESEDEIWEETAKVEPEIQSVADSSSGDEGYDDTKMEEKIRAVLAKQKNQITDSVFLEATDESDTDIEQKQFGDLPKKKLADFFDLKSFFIDHDLSDKLKNQINQYIIAYKGIVVDQPSKDTDYFIFDDETVEFFKEMYPKAIFLKPDWIWDCHNKQGIVPYDNYRI